MRMPTKAAGPLALTDIPAGLCQCGCGKPTAISNRNQRGDKAGFPRRFLIGHSRRLRMESCYIAEDHGYKTPCWIWQGFLNRKGYGATRFAGRLRKAHRVFYMRHKGEIPTGYEVDHLCFVPACVNPDHLEAVTPQENLRRRRIHEKGNA